jgi:hypothetical protein
VYPGAGDRHGYDVIVPRVGSGVNNVCVYAIDVAAPGSNVSLGCRAL